MAVAGGGGGVVRRPAPLAAEAAAVVSRWRPVRWPEDDAAAAVPLLGLVRGWVTVAAPRDARTARRFMRLTAELVVWAQRTLGTTDASTVLASANVEYWVMVVRVDRSAGWRHVARGCLRTVGRAVNPAGWPPVPSGLELPSTPEPYTPPEEEALRFAACLAGWRHRPRRLWVVACSLGAGLLGPEIVAGVRDDLVDLGSGRVGVVVGGRNARLVPVRAGYTALALRAVSEAAVAGRSIGFSGSQNAVYVVCGGLKVGDVGLSLRRARATWLRAHVVAGTPLAPLRAIAGPLSMNTLSTVVDKAAADLDANAAAMEALRA